MTGWMNWPSGWMDDCTDLREASLFGFRICLHSSFTICNVIRHKTCQIQDLDTWTWNRDLDLNLHREPGYSANEGEEEDDEDDGLAKSLWYFVSFSGNPFCGVLCIGYRSRVCTVGTHNGLDPLSLWTESF